MPTLIIPEQYKAGLAALRNLPDSEVLLLVEALNGLPPTTWLKQDLAAAISKVLPGLVSQHADALAVMLQSLYRVQASSEVSLSEFVSDLTDAMEASGKPELQVSSADRGHFIKKMETILGLESPGFLAKASVLQRDHEHIFHSAKILTDLRPVFHAPDEPPREMILEYMLKLVFHDGNRHREMYMALDSGDIAHLREMIERAEKKAVSLKSLLESKGIVSLRLP
jgi:hypothetical protein